MVLLKSVSWGSFSSDRGSGCSGNLRHRCTWSARRKRGTGRTRKTTRYRRPHMKLSRLSALSAAPAPKTNSLPGPTSNVGASPAPAKSGLHAQMDLVSIGEQEQQQQADGEPPNSADPSLGRRGAPGTTATPRPPAPEGGPRRAPSRPCPMMGISPMAIQTRSERRRRRRRRERAAAGAHRVVRTGTLRRGNRCQPEPAVGRPVDGEPARVDDHVDPGDQAQVAPARHAEGPDPGGPG